MPGGLLAPIDTVKARAPAIAISQCTFQQGVYTVYGVKFSFFKCSSLVSNTTTWPFSNMSKLRGNKIAQSGLALLRASVHK